MINIAPNKTTARDFHSSQVAGCEVEVVVTVRSIGAEPQEPAVFEAAVERGLRRALDSARVHQSDK
jgi:hypothetical protein